MILHHHINRYNKFINTIKHQGTRTLQYSEIHHIIPRCMGGTDDPSNLIVLSFREHFLAHWMLYMAYPKSYKLANAFHYMCSVIKGTPQRRKEMRLQYGITGRAFAAVKTRLRDLGNIDLKGIVNCYDTEHGQKVKISSLEYSLYPERYQFHTKGKLNCYNKITDQYEYIGTDIYYANKDFYMVSTKKNLPKTPFKVYDPLTGQIKPMPYDEVVSINKNRSKEDRLLRVIKHKLTVENEHGQKVTVTLDEYKQGNFKHNLTDMIPVFDLEDQKNKILSKIDYEANPQRYLTSTKGKVLAYDTVEGKSLLIDKSLFDKARYVGQTKDLTTVFDKIEQKYVQITKDQAKDKSRYQGPCTGKINVIDIITGKRCQIDKSEQDLAIHLPLGDKKYYFKALHLPKNKVMNIHIYEWKILDQSLYTILDLDLFKNLQQTYNQS